MRLKRKGTEGNNDPEAGRGPSVQQVQSALTLGTFYLLLGYKFFYFHSAYNVIDPADLADLDVPDDTDDHDDSDYPDDIDNSGTTPGSLWLEPTSGVSPVIFSKVHFNFQDTDNKLPPSSP